MCFNLEKVYCFACGQFFKKSMEGFEKCPHCGTDYEDLTKEAKIAVDAMIKNYELSLRNSTLSA